MKKINIVALSILMIFILAGCSKSAETENIEESTTLNAEKEQLNEEENLKEDESSNEKSSETEELSTTKTFTYSIGEEEYVVDIPSEPQNIVVIGYDVIDIVDGLGHKDKIIGIPDPSDPMFPHFLEGYEDVASIGGLWGDDFEAIAGLQPDLIIASQRAFSSIEELNKIAPTVGFYIPGMSDISFEEQLYKNIEDIAYILNDEDAGKESVNNIKESIATLKDKVGELEDPKALFLIVTGKTINMFTDNPGSRFGFVFNEFGFEAIVTEEEINEEYEKSNSGDEASKHGNSISFEFMSSKNPNYLIVLDKGVVTQQSDVAATDTLDNPLIASTNAALNDNIIYLDGTAWYLATGGIKSSEIMINDLMEAISN